MITAKKARQLQGSHKTRLANEEVAKVNKMLNEIDSLIEAHASEGREQTYYKLSYGLSSTTEGMLKDKLTKKPLEFTVENATNKEFIIIKW